VRGKEEEAKRHPAPCGRGGQMHMVARGAVPPARDGGGPASRGRRTTGGPSWAGAGHELGHLWEIPKKIEAGCQGHRAELKK
jgi:hypothetical protein